jgi:CDP-glucose 4,6-dehydratase
VGRFVNDDFWRDRRVLVTGHTGFKGSWLCLWLARAGASVVGYASDVPTHPSLYEAASVEGTLHPLVGDVRDLAALQHALASHRPEIVFHLAAQPLVRRSYSDPVLTYETNLLGTVNLLEAVRQRDDVRVVVVVTTDKVYDQLAARRHAEGDPLGGADPYSSSKAAAELAAAAYRTSFFASGRPAVATARAGNVIGGGDWSQDRLVPDVVAALARNAPLEIRYPRATRPWQHVLNPLDGYVLLAERLWDDPAAASAWNFGPSPRDCRSVEWIARRVAEHWGADLRIVSPTEPQPPEAPSLELDATRAHDGLGWRQRWDLEAALAATVDWYRRYADGEDARLLTMAQIEAFAADRGPVPIRS